MTKIPAWLSYTVLRLLMIVVPLAILLLLFGTRYWPVWVIASVIAGFALSYIFLRGPRERMAQELVAARTRTKQARGDDAVEDAEIEASEPRDTSDGN